MDRFLVEFSKNIAVEEPPKKVKKEVVARPSEEKPITELPIKRLAPDLTKKQVKKRAEIVFSTPVELSGRDKKVVLPKFKVKGGRILFEERYFSVLNEVSDQLMARLKPVEAVIYLRLYRLSFGWGLPVCRVSLTSLKRACGVGSLNTIRKALISLVNKKCICYVYNKDGQIYDNQTGSIFRVFLPQEIIFGKTIGGENLDEIINRGMAINDIAKIL